MSVDIRNAPFAAGDQKSARFEAVSTIMLEVPVSFAGKILPSMQIKVKNTAGYIPKVLTNIKNFYIIMIDFLGLLW